MSRQFAKKFKFTFGSHKPKIKNEKVKQVGKDYFLLFSIIFKKTVSAKTKHNKKTKVSAKAKHNK